MAQTSIRETNRNAMLARGLLILLCAGIINSVSVFVKPLAVFYGWETSAIANVGTTMLTFWPVGAIIGGKLLSKFGARTATVAGAITFGLGLILTGFVPQSNPGLIYFTFSFLIGMGNGIAYTAATYAVISWFPDKRGTAAGLCMAVNGGSSAFLAPLCSYLTVATNIQVTLITAGAVCCAISLFSGLWLRQAPEGYVPVNFDPSKVKKALDTNLESYTISRALKTRQFWFIFICMTFFPALYLVMFSRFSVFMTDRGISLAYATLGVSVYNIANVVGRFGLGALIDKIGYKKVYIICWACCILSAVCLLSASSVAMILLAYFLLGCGFGAANSVYPVAHSTSFGPMYTGGIYGVCLLGYMAFTQIVPRMAAAVIARTGEYTMAFFITMGLSTIAVISMWLVPKLDRKPLAAAEQK